MGRFHLRQSLRMRLESSEALLFLSRARQILFAGDLRLCYTTGNDRTESS